MAKPAAIHMTKKTAHQEQERVEDEGRFPRRFANSGAAAASGRGFGSLLGEGRNGEGGERAGCHQAQAAALIYATSEVSWVCLLLPYNASASVSPVRIRMALVNRVNEDLAVAGSDRSLADDAIASTALSTASEFTAISIFKLGQKAHRIFGAAIDLRVPLLPAVAFDFAHGQALNADSRPALQRTSSSLNGLMMAITIFIWFPILFVRGHAASHDWRPARAETPVLPKKESKAVPVWKWPVILLKYMNNNAGRESRAGHAAAQQVYGLGKILI